MTVCTNLCLFVSKLTFPTVPYSTLSSKKSYWKGTQFGSFPLHSLCLSLISIECNFSRSFYQLYSICTISSRWSMCALSLKYTFLSISINPKLSKVPHVVVFLKRKKLQCFQSRFDSSDQIQNVKPGLTAVMHRLNSDAHMSSQKNQSRLYI